MSKLVELFKKHQIKASFVGGMIVITSVYGSCHINPSAVMGLEAPVEEAEEAEEAEAPAEEAEAPAEPVNEGEAEAEEAEEDAE